MQSFVTWPYVLHKGHSDDPAHGACAMDAINWLVHGQHGDAPACACPVIASYVTYGNDAMPDNIRQRLLPYLYRIAASRSEAHQGVRTRIFQYAARLMGAPLELATVGSMQVTDSPKAAKWAPRAAACALVAVAFLTEGAIGEAAWDEYFVVLDRALNAGPQGAPWSANTIAIGDAAFRAAGGVGEIA
jgi:hypothetical protein